MTSRPSSSSPRLRIVATRRSDGSVRPDEVDRDALARRQQGLTGRRWVMVDEVHGAAVHRSVPFATEPSRWKPMAARADIVVVEARDGTSDAVAIWVGDCAPVMLADVRAGVLVGAHAGWKGLVAGVLDVAVAALPSRATDAATDPGLVAVVGPMIHPCCYEFADADIAVVAEALGVRAADVSGRTRDGRLALDMPAAVSHALARHGIEPDVIGDCTGCARDGAEPRYFSHRVRRDAGRHALVAWIERDRDAPG